MILSESERIAILIDEYKTSLARTDKYDDRVDKTLGVGMAVLTFTATYLSVSKFNMVAAWAFPLGSTLFFVILILMYYFALSMYFNTLICAQYINCLSGDMIIQFKKNYPHYRLFSMKNGSYKIKLIYIMMYVLSITIYLFILLSCFKIIYDNNHFQGIIFISIYITIGSMVIIVASGIFIDIPRSYKYISNFIEKNKRMPSDISYNRMINKYRVKIEYIYKIIPRPNDVFLKGNNFIYGCIAAIMFIGFDNSRVRNINIFFSNGVNWTSIDQVPVWVKLGFCIIAFIAEELLLQQSKLLWDDVRDSGRDKELLHNRNRAIAKGIFGKKEAIIHIIFRWIMAIIGAYFLGDMILVYMFLIISLHQAIYVLFSKQVVKFDGYSMSTSKLGNTFKRGYNFLKNKGLDIAKIQILFIIGPSVAFRFMAGVIVVVGDKWNNNIFIILFALFYYTCFGAMSAFWRIEAEYYYPKMKRPQSEYYLRYGKYWECFGLLISILIGLLLVFINLNSNSCHLSIKYIIGYNCYNAIDVLYSPYSMRLLFILFIIIPCLFIINFIIFKYILRIFLTGIHFLLKLKYIDSIIRSCKVIGFPVSLIIMVYGLISEDTLYILISFTLLSLWQFIAFLTMSYLEYSIDWLRLLTYFIPKIIYLYLFDETMSFRSALSCVSKEMKVEKDAMETHG